MGSGKEQVQPSASLTMLTVGMLICGARKRTSSVICFVGHADVRMLSVEPEKERSQPSASLAMLTVGMLFCGARKRAGSDICFADRADHEDADLWSQEKNRLSHLLRWPC